MGKLFKGYRYFEIVMVSIGVILFTKQVKDEIDG